MLGEGGGRTELFMCPYTLKVQPKYLSFLFIFKYKYYILNYSPVKRYNQITSFTNINLFHGWGGGGGGGGQLRVVHL